MGLNIKNPEVERLVEQVTAITGETKTEAIRQAMVLRLRQVTAPTDSAERLSEMLRYLEKEVWPRVPAEHMGRPLSKEEREEILGYGPGGV